MSDSDDEPEFLQHISPSLQNDLFHHFTQLYNKGSGTGYTGIAGCHYKGLATKVDKPAAISLYLEASLRGDSQAQIKLALCFLKGSGTQRNVNKAFDWFKRAALANNPYALYAVSLFHFFGQKVKVNLQISRTTLLQAIGLGSSHAHAEYGTQLLFLDNDINLALVHFSKAAVHGNLWAKYYLGTLYLYGDENHHRQEGLSLLLSSARRGRASAQLAFAYFTRDQAVTSTFVNACLTKAALNNHPEAVYERGVRLFSGLGMPQNLVEARKHFYRSHMLGFPISFYMLTLLDQLLAGKITLETLDTDQWRKDSHASSYPQPFSGEIVRSPFATNLPGISFFRPLHNGKSASAHRGTQKNEDETLELAGSIAESHTHDNHDNHDNHVDHLENYNYNSNSKTLELSADLAAISSETPNSNINGTVTTSVNTDSPLSNGLETTSPHNFPVALDIPTTLSLIQANLSEIIPLPPSFSDVVNNSNIQLPQVAPVTALKPYSPFPDPRLEKCFCCISTQRQVLSSCGHWLFCNACFQLFSSCPICTSPHDKFLITQVKPTLCFFSK